MRGEAGRWYRYGPLAPHIDAALKWAEHEARLGERDGETWRLHSVVAASGGFIPIIQEMVRVSGRTPCLWCHKPVPPPKPHGKSRAYCSTSCKQRAYEHRKRVREERHQAHLARQRALYRLRGEPPPGGD